MKTVTPQAIEVPAENRMMSAMDTNDDIPWIWLLLAVVALLLGVAVVIVSVALFWRDVGGLHLLDPWFGTWSELKLTLVDAALMGASLVVLRVVLSRKEIRQRTRGAVEKRDEE